MFIAGFIDAVAITIVICAVIAFFIGIYDGFYGPGTVKPVMLSVLTVFLVKVIFELIKRS